MGPDPVKAKSSDIYTERNQILNEEEENKKQHYRLRKIQSFQAKGTSGQVPDASSLDNYPETTRRVDPRSYVQHATGKNYFFKPNMREQTKEKKVTGTGGTQREPQARYGGVGRVIDTSVSSSVNCGSEQMDI